MRRTTGFLVALGGGAALAFLVPPPCAVAPPPQFFSIAATVVERRSASVVCVDADDQAPSPDDQGGLIPMGDMERLRQRIQSIQENGLSSPAQKLFELAMQTPPQQMLREFFTHSPASVTQAMQEAVVSLLGALPPLEFDAQVTTTGDKLAALMLQLQMTGYMLRNAEYVMALRRVLDLKTRSADEYREAFERVDLDGSGYIESKEVEELLTNVYGGEPPPFEVASFVSLFDTDGDGKISWDEFSTALGVADTAAKAGGDSGEADLALPSPMLSGEVTVELDDGSTVEMDASAYMEELKAEAMALREELGQMKSQK